MTTETQAAEWFLAFEDGSLRGAGYGDTPEALRRDGVTIIRPERPDETGAEWVTAMVNPRPGLAERAHVPAWVVQHEAAAARLVRCELPRDAYAPPDETRALILRDGETRGRVHVTLRGQCVWSHIHRAYLYAEDAVPIYDQGTDARSYLHTLCLSDDWTPCGDCGVHFQNPDFETYCPNCERNHQEGEEESSDRTIADYHSLRADQVFGFIDDTGAYSRHPVGNTMYAGVELELECADTTHRDLAAERVKAALGHVIICEDGSLRNGFEIISAPMTLTAQRALWRKLTPEVTRGLRGTPSTAGMHVHVSRAALTPLQIGKMVVFLNASVNYRFITAIAGRESSSYCRRHADKGEPHLLAQNWNNQRNRYDALNLCNRATVEFRIFKASTQRERVLKNVEFCFALAAYARYASINALTAREFCLWLTQPAQRKEYPLLVKFLQARGTLPQFSRPDQRVRKTFALVTEGLLPSQRSGEPATRDADALAA